MEGLSSGSMTRSMLLPGVPTALRLLPLRPLATAQPKVTCSSRRSPQPRYSRRGGARTVVRSASTWNADAWGEEDHTDRSNASEELEQAKARAEALRQRRRVAMAGNSSTDPVLWSHAASRARDGGADSSHGSEATPTPTPAPNATRTAMLPVVLAAGAVGALALFGGPKQVHANIFNDRTKAMVERWGSTFKEESFTEPASLGEMMSYKTQKVFAFPLYYRLATLVVASTAAVCLGGLLYMTVTGSDWNTSVFQSYVMLNNVPGADAGSGDGELKHLIMSNLLYLIGLFTFALLIGIVSDAVSEKVEDVRHGNHQVLERNHTVILNWNDSMIPLLRQLAVCQEESNGRQDLKHIVVLADKDKSEMDADVESLVLEDHENVEIITRSGVPYTLSNLKKVAVWDADNVILLQPEGSDEEPPKGYYHSSKMATTIYGLHQHARKKQNVVIEMPLEVKDKTLVENALNALRTNKEEQKNYERKNYERVYPEALLAKVAAQCSLQPGLAPVFGELLVQSIDGAEFYFEPAGRRFVGKTFGETWRCFKEVVLVGVLHTDGSLNLAPAESYVLQADDRLIFIADDEKQLKTGYNASPAASSSYTTGDVWSAKMMQKKAKKAKRAKPPHLVMLGCNPRVGDYLSGLDEFAEKGTIVTLVSETNLKSLVDFKDYPNLKIQTITGSPLDEANLEAAKVWEATSVRIVASKSELQDSDVLPVLGILGSKFKLTQDGNKSHLLVELLDDQNTPMGHNIVSSMPGMDRSKVHIRVNDSLLSGMISQVASNCLVQNVLAELTRAEGGEFYLTPVEKVLENFGEYSFGEVTARVRALDATTLGYMDAEGGGVSLNPNKDSVHTYKPGDMLIVIADEAI